jgi:acetyl esterase/lipase
MAIRYDPSARFDIEAPEDIYRSGPNGGWPARRYRKPCPTARASTRRFNARDAGVERLMKSLENYFSDKTTVHEGNPTLVLKRGEQTHLPPALILQGTKDDNVLLEISKRFIATYLAPNEMIEHELLPDMPHVFERDPGPETNRTIVLIKTFIAQQFS